MIKVHDQSADTRKHVEKQAAGSVAPTPAPAPAQAGVESPAAEVSAAQSMIKAMDTDGSGVVEKAEIDAFAKSQGLSAAETAEEFKDLDKNNDGQLDSTEISSTVAQYTSTAAPLAASNKATPATATAAASSPAQPAAKAPTAAAPSSKSAPAASVPTTEAGLM